MPRIWVGRPRRGWGAPSARRPRGSSALRSRLGHREPTRLSAARDCTVMQACSARYGVAGSVCPDRFAKARPAPRPPPRHGPRISEPANLHPPQPPPHRRIQKQPTAPIMKSQQTALKTDFVTTKSHEILCTFLLPIFFKLSDSQSSD